MKRTEPFGNMEREMERFMVNLYKRSLRKHGLDPKNLKGNWSEADAILEARLGKVSRTAKENKHRLVTLYRIAVDEVKANQS
ncbi:MAG TPA: hypothetical protein VMU60_04830 [Syntrophobacteria bacterium]|nr:hypothetical protein [Syntrophobacteria bacterium]